MLKKYLGLFIGLLTCVSLIFLFSCQRKDPSLPIPIGMQEYTGILHPAELSLVRRGTHLFESDTGDQFFVESTELVLRDYEGKRITIQGVIEENVDVSFAPVLLPEKITILDEDYQSVSLRSVGFSVEVPDYWGIIKGKKDVQFLIPDLDTPVVSIFFEGDIEYIPTGTPITVGKKRGTRTLDEATGNQTVLFPHRDGILTLLFTPKEMVEDIKLREQFLYTVRSIIFAKDTKNISSSDSDNTPSKLGSPCGGSAGVLCPEGYLCVVENLEDGVGKCQKL
jgi:hypothetical protein